MKTQQRIEKYRNSENINDNQSFLTKSEEYKYVMKSEVRNH